MTTHNLTIDSMDVFRGIIECKKTVEGRIKKFGKVYNVGDSVTFTHGSLIVHRTIRYVREYSGIEEYLIAEKYQNAVPHAKNIEEAKAEYDKYYPQGGIIIAIGI